MDRLPELIRFELLERVRWHLLQRLRNWVIGNALRGDGVDPIRGKNDTDRIVWQFIESTRRAEQPFRSGREILFENVYTLVRRAIEQFEPSLMCECPVLIEQAYAECNERGCRDTDDQDKEDQNAARRPQPFADARHTAVHLHLFEHPSMAVSSRLRQDCVNALRRRPLRRRSRWTARFAIPAPLSSDFF